MSGVWAGIVRVSDLGGRDVQADSFRAGRDQIKAIRAGVPTGDRVIILDPEYDVSGGRKLEQRPSLLKAVEGVERGEYLGIIVAYHSRLGREVAEEERVWQRVEQAGGRIIMASDQIDTTTVDGRVFRRIRSAINQGERERHVERFDALRRDLTQEGVWQARIVPLGYEKTQGRLVPSGQAEQVRQAFRDKAQGVSTLRIATGLGMSPSGVAGLLRNRVYLGELRVGRYVNPTAHSPIVDTDLWLRAQHSRTVYVKRTEPTMLDGLVKCAGCGKAMSRGGENASVWACRRVHSGGLCPSPAGVRHVLLNALVDELVREQIARLVAQPTRDTIPLERARERLRRAESERDAYLEAVRAADLGASVFATGLRARQGDVEHAEGDLARLLGEGERTALPVDALDSWEQMTSVQRNHVLRGLVDHVAVTRAGGRGGGHGPRQPLSGRVRVVWA